MIALHGRPQHPEDDELARATRTLRALGDHRRDEPDAVRRAAEDVGLRCLVQRPATPRSAGHSPAELADLITRRSWWHLWSVDDAAWAAHVEPALRELRALPDQHRPRVQLASTTVTVLGRP